MRRIIKEQSVPSANALNTNGIVNEPFNVYGDPQNKKFIESFTILSLKQGTQGYFDIEVKDNEGNRDKFFFKCSDAGLRLDGNSNSLYSNNLVNELKKRYCTKSTGGAAVPNATFASTTNKNPQANAMAEGKRIVRLTESDLVRLVKKVIEEQATDTLKDELADLKDDLKSELSWDPWKDTDDLLDVYNKLLPFKGKKVSTKRSSRYGACNFDTVEKPALNYFNDIWNHSDNRYCMGDGVFDFITYIKKIEDNDFWGDTEKSKDGKYTTPQVKNMIMSLVQKG